MTTEPLLECPVCRYDLRGLPQKHRCPECGFEYDETTYVWPRGGVQYFSLLPTVLFFTLLFSFFGILQLVRGGIRSGTDSLTVLNAALSLFGFFLWVKFWRSRPFLAVSASGIAYRMPLRAVRSIPWNEIEIAGSSASFRILRLTQAKRKPVRLPDAWVRQRGRADIHHELLGRWHQWKDANPS
jgi:hypothetical protein